MKKLLFTIIMIGLMVNAAWAATTPVSDLVNLTVADVADTMYIVDATDTGDTASKQINWSQLQGSITKTGTVATGVWNGTDIAVPDGGTGAGTFTDGGVLVGSGTSAITALAVMTEGQILIGDGTTDPAIATMGTDASIASTGALTIADSVAVASWNLTTPTITTSLTTDSKTISEAEIGILDGGIEGTEILSTGESGGTKFLREDSDGTCSWQTPAGSGDMTKAVYDTDASDTVDYAENVDDADYGEVTVTAGSWTLDDSVAVTSWNLTTPTATTSLTTDYLTASEIVISSASKEIISAPVATYPSLAELAYVKGTTSALQTQIDKKLFNDADDTTTASLFVLDSVYATGWNGDASVPTKNAVYDKIETISATKMKFEKGLALETPVADDTFLIYKSRYAWTPNAITGAIEPQANDSSDTASVSFWECTDDGDTVTIIGTIIITADAVSDSALAGLTIDDNDWVRVTINSIGDAPTSVSVTIEGTED